MVGPAAQTFAVYRALAKHSGETFASLAVIAAKACVPRPTVKRHVEQLLKAVLLKHKGRQRRRTATYYVSQGYLSANHGLSLRSFHDGRPRCCRVGPSVLSSPSSCPGTH